MGNEQGKLPGGPTPAGIQTMDETLQKKFSKGIQYNMKIVIRGDRNSGKTTLFHRMEGKPFNESYIPTNEIQVTSILWSYRVTNDTVKVEIWDTVDKARPQNKENKGKGGGLKMFNSAVEEVDVPEENGNGKALDASFLDVYKGAHGVVFIFDIIKQWTWKYVERELPRVPLHVPIIILANFCDMHEHRLVTKEDCIMAIKYLDRPEGAADIRYAECSLKNGFGLMHLHKFLSVPFLQLQQETLLQQLQVNREQMMAAMEELDTAVETEDQNYAKYLAKLERLSEEKKRRIMMAKLQQEQDQSSNHQPEADTSTSTTTRQSQPATPPTKHSTTHSESRSHSHQQQQEQQQDSQATSAAPPQRSNSLASRFSSKLSGFLSKKEEDKPPEAAQEAVQAARSSRPRVASKTNIEEFVPEGEGVDDFLSGGDDNEEEEDEDEDDSDDDSATGNPMIAGDEDLSSLDEVPAVTPPTKNKDTPTIVRSKKQISFSDSESEEDQPVAILTPIQAPAPAKPASTKSKPTPKQLKSAKDIELTESEEEDDGPQIMADEDFDFDDTKAKKITKNRDDIFEPSPPAPVKKQAGLMLQFDPSITSPPAAVTVPSGKSSKPTKDPVEDSKDSPSSDSRRGDKKKKKSKKSKHHHKEEEKKETVKKAEEPADVSAPSDPYGAIASLDAWLNSTSDDVQTDILTPVPAAGLAEVGTEEAMEEEGGEAKSKKTKKHKHRKHRDGDEEGGEERSSSKKKHRSHHKSSRHRKLEQDD